jgi:non-lysosomal glucosylceramidase
VRRVRRPRTWPDVQPAGPTRTSLCYRRGALGEQLVELAVKVVHGGLRAGFVVQRRAQVPFPYYAEVMTGFEYAAGVHMLYEGQVDEGLSVIRAIRACYDGRKRSPFNEAECGHHYARATASWAAMLALTGFHYSGVTQQLKFAAAGPPSPTTWFWSNGSAWGTVTQSAPHPSQPPQLPQPLSPGQIATRHVTLRVIEGTLAVRRLELSGFGTAELETPVQIDAHTECQLVVRAATG